MILGCVLFPGLWAQNLLDEQGRKTGPWKVDYPNGKTQYRGEFREGRPVGLLTRYYPKGFVQARIHFRSEEVRYVRLYNEGGKLAAEGLYQGRQKDSVWTYYSGRDTTLVLMRESYSMGSLNGPVMRYYDSGAISEQVNWQNNLRDGAWLQYYEDGKMRLQANYHQGLLNGPYKVWYRNEIPMMEGQMKNDLSEGRWKYFDEEGALQFTIDYVAGIPADRELYRQMMEEHMARGDSSLNAAPVKPF